MMKTFLFNLIIKRNYDISIYTEEIFERRCQEEIIRSDEDNSYFVYLEFDFEALRKVIPEEDEFNQFWDVFFAALSKGGRSSDIIGFLENEAGIGLLLLDSRIEGWTRVKGRIDQMAIVLDFKKDMMSILNKVVKPILYPACIQNVDNPAVQASSASV